MNKKLVLICVVLAALLGYSCKEDSDNAFLKIDNAKLSHTFDALGGMVSIPVNSNNAFEVTPASSWCGIAIAGQSVKITVDKMESENDRTAEIWITSKGCTPVTITVSQKALWVNEDMKAFSLGNEGGEFTLEFTSSSTVQFDLPAWIHEKEGNSWSWGQNRFTFITDAYDEADPVRSGKVLVRVKGSDVSCPISIEQTKFTNEAVLTLYKLWQTDPMNANNERQKLLEKMQEYADLLSPDDFQKYLVASERAALKMEEDYSILACYRYAFNHILDEVKNDRPENGSVSVWMLYNMGIIVKTPSGCFGVDINHRLAKDFAPYLDFLCVTHNHADHTSTELMQAMYSAGKPVVSNFYTASSIYYSKFPASYTIGKFSVRTAITDHDDELRNFISVFRISCGDDSGNFSILHCGDSTFDQNQFGNVEGGNIGLLVLRNGAKVENNIIGQGAGKIMADYAFLSHVIELRHQIGKSPIRFPLMETLKRTAQINCENTQMPFWGEKQIWKNGKLK